MKILFTTLFLITCFSFNAQSFIGKGDSKFQVGANIQSNTTGINFSYDYGLGENFSIGLSSSYALSVKEELNANFGDRIDLRARFNANLSSVLNIDENFDFYPGLSLGLKNFGVHTGIRYFFSHGFGLYAEFGFPIAKYKTEDLTPREKIHNNNYLNIGASFNLGY